MFVYNDAMGHVTQFWPPDWLLPHTGVSRGTMGIVYLVSCAAALWLLKPCKYFFSFYPVTKVWYQLSNMSVDQ